MNAADHPLALTPRSVTVHLPAQKITDETLAEIEAQFGEGGDGVWISPAFARKNGISAEDEARVEAAVAGTEAAELRVLLVDVDHDDDRFNGSYTQLVSWVQDDLGGDAVYVGWSEYEAAIDLQGTDYSDDAYYVDRLAALEAPGDLAAQMEKASELIDDGNASELWSALDDDEKYSSRSDDDGTGLAWVTVTLIVVVIAVVIVAWGKLATRRDRANVVARGSGEKFALPTTVLRTVRQAEDRSLRRLAEAEVAALGEQLVAQDLENFEPGPLAVWAQAMEHHEVARRVLEQGRTPADVVGALVLVRRGEEARAVAVAGDVSWAPQPGCWFNPLHGGSAKKVDWNDPAHRSGSRSVTVPACHACAREVSKGREPEDVLDFVEGERVVHYYRLDIGVWSRTGYGSLETDLVGALRSSRPSRWRRRGA